MLQLRNLNIDPDIYADVMLTENVDSDSFYPAGVDEAIAHIRDCFPSLAVGNFTMPIQRK